MSFGRAHSTLQEAVDLMHTAQHQHCEYDYTEKSALIASKIEKTGEYSEKRPISHPKELFDNVPCTVDVDMTSSDYFLRVFVKSSILIP